MGKEKFGFQWNEVWLDWKNMKTILFFAVVLFCTLGLSNSPHEWRRVEVSAYCPCFKCCEKNPGDPGYGKTATGSNAWNPGVAVDPKVFPYGVRIDIPHYNRGVNGNGSWILADDTGGAMRQATKNGKIQIDIRYETHQEALNYGRKKNVLIRIWTNP